MIKLLELIGNMPNEANFKKRMRLHQGWWRAFVLGEHQGRHPRNEKEYICSMLLNGHITKNNFLSKMVSDIVKTVTKMRDENSSGIINVERLYNNLLSSQPLCFNFFAPFYAEKDLALKFIKNIYPDITAVTEIYFEYSNKNHKYDNSAYDAAFEVMREGKKGIIGIECKYTDTFSKKPYRKEEYLKIYQQTKIYSESYDGLTSSRFNQLFRNQLIGESFKMEGAYDFAYLVLFCHQKDEDALNIAKEYTEMLKKDSRECFKIFTYKDYFETMQRCEIKWEMREYLMLLWARYCGLSLSKVANDQLLNVEDGYCKVHDVDPCEMQNKNIVKRAEGGTIYTAEIGNDLYVVSNFSTLDELLSKEELVEHGTLVTIYKFKNEYERSEFIKKYKS